MSFSWHFWLGFHLFILVMLVADLGIFHRKSRKVGFRESLLWSLLWIVLALCFDSFLYLSFGRQAALEFLTGYFIEKSLSVDNLFVFVMVFSFCGVKPQYQYKVLFFGVLGALLMRAGFILGGIELLHLFHSVTYVFGGFLVLTGIRMAFRKENSPALNKNFFFRRLQSFMRVKNSSQEDQFFFKEKGKLYATPLFLALVFIEFSDLLFAVDSIPATLAVTSNSFLVYTSNIFAILGLRSLYFTLASFVQMFTYLNIGLAVILVFIGGQMLFRDLYVMPTGVTLGFVCLVLFLTVLPSIKWSSSKTVQRV